ncbi:MAG: methyltransferase domain-containing protein [Alphaproteobacteria bacterium]|nr:methyltransferase domain-containing protein [Alphaproteobacteria bacterium]
MPSQSHLLSPSHDPYARLAEADAESVRVIADRLERRAAHPDQRAMTERYLADIPWPVQARVLDAGCGTGAVTRRLAARPEVASVLGIDPSPILIARARELARAGAISFEVGDARALAAADTTFDVVVFHTVLCHLPGADKALAEARRVLKPGGWLAVFDGDYASATVALGPDDPLQACTAAAIAHNVHDRWLVRRLPFLIEQAGFALGRFQSHGYAEIAEPEYLVGQIARGADFLAADGMIGRDLADALKNEAKRRATEGRFFGHIAYASIVAQKA